MNGLLSTLHTSKPGAECQEVMSWRLYAVF